MSTLLPDELTHSHFCPVHRQSWSCEDADCLKPAEVRCSSCAGWASQRVATRRREEA